MPIITLVFLGNISKKRDFKMIAFTGLLHVGFWHEIYCWIWNNINQEHSLPVRLLKFKNFRRRSEKFHSYGKLSYRSRRYFLGVHCLIPSPLRFRNAIFKIFSPAAHSFSLSIFSNFSWMRQLPFTQSYAAILLKELPSFLSTNRNRDFLSACQSISLSAHHGYYRKGLMELLIRNLETPKICFHDMTKKWLKIFWYN